MLQFAMRLYILFCCPSSSFWTCLLLLLFLLPRGWCLRRCGDRLTTTVDNAISKGVVFLFCGSSFFGFFGGGGFGGAGGGCIGDGGDTWFATKLGFGCGAGGFLGRIGICDGLNAGTMSRRSSGRGRR